jgi:hypothetical protein
MLTRKQGVLSLPAMVYDVYISSFTVITLFITFLYFVLRIELEKQNKKWRQAEAKMEKLFQVVKHI